MSVLYIVWCGISRGILDLVGLVEPLPCLITHGRGDERDLEAFEPRVTESHNVQEI